MQCREETLAKERRCIELQEEVHNAAKQFEAELEETKKGNNELLDRKAGVTSELNKTEDLLEEKIQHIQGLSKNHFALMNQTTVLE